MIYTVDRELARVDVERYTNILNGTLPWPVKEDTLTVLSVDFGEGWEMDINLCRGEPTPYVDAILFSDGSEVYVWEIQESVLGEWSVVLGGVINKAFRLEVFSEEQS